MHGQDRAAGSLYARGQLDLVGGPERAEAPCSPCGKPLATLTSFRHLPTILDWAYRVIQNRSLGEVSSFAFKAVALSDAIALTFSSIDSILFTYPIDTPYSRAPFIYAIDVIEKQ